MSTAASRDGTTIAFEQVGAGPALILVDGAMCYRAAGPLPALAQALAPAFTVYTYDRRGRGDSGDTPPYAVAREVEDLAALIAESGPAFAYGISSGAALALEAAASGLPITKVALYEPPFTAEEGDPRAKQDYTKRLTELLSADRRGDAVELFMTLVGMPPALIAGMRTAPVWPVFEAIAQTLAYDDAVLGDGTVPRDRAALVTQPAMVAYGEASPANLRSAAIATADVLSDCQRRGLAGQTHDVDPGALAPILSEFFL
ncbi:MAG TPA: alpha/beta fold hydrolase [Streptosporangiaceae bacterium]|jgi:pimeloyl-ACP methyl ester carboxylesterase|nr:alpha/beta fold hydrolase [Streptosporangiaceae bacterium]